VTISRDFNSNLIIKINGTTDKLTLSNWFFDDAYKIEQVKFANGTLWNAATLVAKTQVATDGDDYLTGNTGANNLSGLKGNDTYIVDHAGDKVNENPNEGIDNVLASISYTLAANVENLTLTGNTAINGTGNELNNSITGNSAGNVLNGGAGNDYLNGGYGSYDYNTGTYTGNGNDTYVFGIGSGEDIIYDYNSYGDLDTVQLGAGITTTDVTISRDSINLFVNINGTGDQLRLFNWFFDDASKIEQVKFANGTVWNTSNLLAQTTTTQKFNFTFTYGNGDHYSGFGYAAENTYTSNQSWSTVADENNRTGTYRITAVSTIYNLPAGAAGRIYVDQYYDVESDRTVVPDYDYANGGVKGTSGLGSEHGTILGDSNLGTFGFSATTAKQEADIDLSNILQICRFTFRYGNGDSYTGAVYASTGTYQEGESWTVPDENGQNASYTIDQVDEVTDGAIYSIANKDKVFVESYYDSETEQWFVPDGYANDNASGNSGLGSEHDTLLGNSSVGAFGFNAGLGQQLEADIDLATVVERYGFTFTYSNGDSYTGYTFANPGTYTYNQIISVTDENGGAADYTIDSVALTANHQTDKGKVFVEHYYDAETDLTLTPDNATLALGTTGLRSEQGTLLGNTTVGRFGFNVTLGQQMEADIDTNATAQYYTFTFTYGNGDYYQGHGYAEIGTYSNGGNWTVDDENGATGTYNIDSLVLQAQPATDKGKVYVDHYYDFETNRTLTPDNALTALGSANLESEHGTLLGNSTLGAFGFNAVTGKWLEADVNATPVNRAPTLTAFSVPVTTGDEDSQITVTFANLKTQGDEADVDGMVTAFIIKDLSSGTLKIGTSAKTATGWDAANNNTIDAAHNAYWTPAANANGTLNAFTAVAKDNGGLESSTAIQAVVAVTAVNDKPDLTTPATINYIDTTFDDTFATVTGSLAASDIEGSPLIYGIVSVVDVREYIAASGTYVLINTLLTGPTIGADENGNSTLSQSSPYGVLTVTTSTGAYSFVANDAGIEALSMAANVRFTVTAKEWDGVTFDSETLAINIAQQGRTESISNDRLTGTSGDDRFDGLAGADTMTGRSGNDTYTVDNARDRVIESTRGGTDTVISSISYTLSFNVENLTLTGTAALNGTGNTLNNILTGNDGANTLNGGVGADTLIGGLGNDIYIMDNDGDVVTETSNLTTEIDTVKSSKTYTLGANLENLTLTSSAAIDGTGNALDNVLTGNKGANVLNGGGGDDTLEGGIGNDTLTGGAGHDTFLLKNTSKDTITDFSVSDDTIQLDNSVFTQLTTTDLTETGVLNSGNFKIGATAVEADDYVIYDSDSGALYYDTNGSDPGGATQIAVLGTGLALTHADFFVI